MRDTGQAHPYRTVLALLLAVAGGGLWALQFGPRAFVLAPWAAAVPLCLLLAERAPGRLGWLYGTFFWIVGVPWLVPTLETYGSVPPWLAWLLVTLLALYLGAYWGLFGALGAPLWRAGGWRALCGLPALWVGLEWARAHLLSGFPWNLAAYAWVDVSGALPLAAWVGAYGVSFVALFANVGIARGVARRRWEPAAVGALAPLLVLALAGRWGGSSPGEPVEPESRPVRIVQPDVRNLTVFQRAEVERGYATVMAMARRACDGPGALVVLPESSAWPFTFQDSPRLRRDLEEVAARGCPVLFNSPRTTRQGVYNSVFLLSSQGLEAVYDKRHLVPFGEYVPLAGVFPFLGKIARQAGDFTPAHDLRLLIWGRELLGPAICFEIVFPAEVAEEVRAGATVLVTVTNDAWYGDTAAPWQHFRAARFRAAENRRPLIRAAITGVSALISADGRVASSLGVFRQGIISGRVQGLTAITPYTRRPWLVPMGCVVIAAFAIFCGLQEDRR